MPDGLSFDLVVTTLGRVSELSELLESLSSQTHRRFRVIVVDQNRDGLIDDILDAEHGFPIVRVTSGSGISRGRNRALLLVRADVVAFPDDDCRYPSATLALVAEALADPGLDGVAGRLVDFESVPHPGSWRADSGPITLGNFWSSGVSATMFLRSRLVEQTGLFDTRLGLGSDVGQRSGEETDYLVRALRNGARLRYAPALVVEHRPTPVTVRFSTERGLRDGLSMGYVLRKNGLSARLVARMLVRPLLGIPGRLAHGDVRGARFQAATLAGRTRGLVAGTGGSRR